MIKLIERATASKQCWQFCEYCSYLSTRPVPSGAGGGWKVDPGLTTVKVSSTPSRDEATAPGRHGDPVTSGTTLVMLASHSSSGGTRRDRCTEPASENASNRNQFFRHSPTRPCF